MEQVYIGVISISPPDTIMASQQVADPYHKLATVPAFITYHLPGDNTPTPTVQSHVRTVLLP